MPVLAFSTDRSVAGDGIYLLGFLPENDTTRVVTYAIAQGHHKFAALVPSTAYGDVTLDALKGAVTDGKAELGEVDRFAGTVDTVLAPAATLAKTDADAVFLPLGGPVLRAAAPTLGTGGLNRDKVKLLGTGQWSDPGQRGRADAERCVVRGAGSQERDEFRRQVPRRVRRQSAAAGGALL